jgi:hypothetical protein
VGTRRGRVAARLSLIIALVGLIVLACGSPTPSPSPTTAAGGQPTIVIEFPASGTPTMVSQPLSVVVRAVDTVGVSRVDLRVGDILVDSVRAPGGVPQTNFVATLQWVPSAAIDVTLAAVAYRSDGTASEPATVLVQVLHDGSPPTPGETPMTSPEASPDPGTSPGLTPSPAPRPTLPPFATPTPEPTPSPTPEPATPTPQPATPTPQSATPTPEPATPEPPPVTPSPPPVTPTATPATPTATPTDEPTEAPAPPPAESPSP